MKVVIQIGFKEATSLCKPVLTDRHFPCIWFHGPTNNTHVVKPCFKLCTVHSSSLSFGALICT